MCRGEVHHYDNLTLSLFAPTASLDPPPGDHVMNLRISELLAIAAFAPAGLLGSAQRHFANRTITFAVPIGKAGTALGCAPRLSSFLLDPNASRCGRFYARH